jgi:hypothetical protein
MNLPPLWTEWGPTKTRTGPDPIGPYDWSFLESAALVGRIKSDENSDWSGPDQTVLPELWAPGSASGGMLLQNGGQVPGFLRGGELVMLDGGVVTPRVRWIW